MKINAQLLEAFKKIPILLFAVVASGCWNSQNDDIHQWMNSEKGKVATSIKPVAPPIKFTPQDYEHSSDISPFNNQRLLQALRRDSAQSNNLALLTPELSRKKEILEGYSLDAMSMVGSLDQNKQRIALVKVEKLIYQVKVGNYLGQNFGRITKITESEIMLRELIQDGAGEWVERQASLQLQRNEK